MKELSKLTTTESGTKLLGMPSVPPASVIHPETGVTPVVTPVGSDEGTDAPCGSNRLGRGQYHAEGGVTDGCYALYNSNAGQVEQVLAQLKVGGGGKGGMGKCRGEGDAVIDQCRALRWTECSLSSQGGGGGPSSMVKRG